MEAIWGYISGLLLFVGVFYAYELKLRLKSYEEWYQDSLNKIEKLEFYLEKKDDRIDELKQEYKIGCKRPHVIFKTIESKLHHLTIKDNLKSIIPKLIVSRNLYDYMNANHKIDIGIFHSDMKDLNSGNTLSLFFPFGYYIKNSEGDYVVYKTPFKYDQEIQLYYHDEYNNIDHSQFISITVSKPRVVTINDLSKVSELYFHAKELIQGSEGCSFKQSLNYSFNYYEKLLEINKYFVCYEYSMFNDDNYNVETFDSSDLVAF